MAAVKHQTSNNTNQPTSAADAIKNSAFVSNVVPNPAFAPLLLVFVGARVGKNVGLIVGVFVGAELGCELGALVHHCNKLPSI